MVWFFERHDERIEVETRFDNSTLEYVVIVRHLGHQEQIARFPDAGALRTRLVELTRELEEDQWLISGPPLILPEGWPDKRPPR